MEFDGACDKSLPADRNGHINGYSRKINIASGQMIVSVYTASVSYV